MKQQRLEAARRVIGIGLFGATGRMGQAIRHIADGRDDVTIAHEDPDVFVDFSTPDALGPNLDIARRARRPIVVGTTGLGPLNQALIDEAAREIAILESSNMSLGVNLIAHLVREAAARLGEDWDIEIVEMHHRHKVDAPSGTALMLGRAAAAGRDVDFDAVADRGDRPGAREAGRIGFAALRGGSVAGDHHVVFATDGERVEIGHRAETRDIFARGALKAARWIVGKPAGRYDMSDVLGLD